MLAEGGTTTVARPAPLVLVSELRVDRAVAPAAPARAAPTPQSISDDFDDEDDLDLEDLDLDEEEENLFADSRGFAEFAERLGAQGLPALLEAAAAYAACIEGRPHFSRPQIMRQVANLVDQAGTNREDSLRSFGSLLRVGKIVKVKRGQYALSDSSHVLAEARKLVG